MTKQLTKTYLLAIAVIASLFSVSGAVAQEAKKASVVVEAPWARASHAGVKTAGGYVHLVNNGDKDDFLVAVKSPIAAKIQLHKMALVNNIMKCKLLQHPILVKAHSDFTLKPGAFHIMFMDLKKPLVKGETFPAVFFFKHSAPVNATFVVGGMDDVSAPVSAKEPVAVITTTTKTVSK